MLTQIDLDKIKNIVDQAVNQAVSGTEIKLRNEIQELRAELKRDLLDLKNQLDSVEVNLKDEILDLKTEIRIYGSILKLNNKEYSERFSKIESKLGITYISFLD